MRMSHCFFQQEVRFDTTLINLVVNSRKFRMASMFNVTKRMLSNRQLLKYIKQPQVSPLFAYCIPFRSQSVMAQQHSPYDEYEQIECEAEDVSTSDLMSETNPLKNKTFLWEADMIQFWGSLGFNAHLTNIIIDLGHAKYSDPKLLSSLKLDIAKFAEYSLEQCRHLRSPVLAQRHLQKIQRLFPNMILNKAIYYNPYLLTLTLSTIEKRKVDLIDLISTHLTEETNPNKYNHLFRKQDTAQNTDKYAAEEQWSKAEVMELMDWDKLFENVSVYLTKDFADIIKQIHVIKKLLCVNYQNNMGLSQIELIELLEVYPAILKADHLSFLSKFRFFIEYASPAILRKRKYLFNEEIDLTMIGNEEKYKEDVSFSSFENMLSDPRVCNGYKMVLQYLVSNGWIFNYTWVRWQRFKYLNYNPEMRKKYSIKEVIKMKSPQFVNAADYCWKEYCHKTKKSHAANMNLDSNWRDSNIDKYMDYEEFMKNELREHMSVIVQWNNDNVEDTKLLLKKNKAKLRMPFMDKYKKNKQQRAEEEGLMEEEVQNNKKRQSILEGKTYTLVEKQERKMYLNKMRKLEQMHGRLCRLAYAPTKRDVKNFLRKSDDFGFNYQLKYDVVDKLTTDDHGTRDSDCTEHDMEEIDLDNDEDIHYS
eukprot:603848_1